MTTLAPPGEPAPREVVPRAGPRAVILELVTKGLVYGLGASLNGLLGFLLLPFVVHRLVSVEYGRFALAELQINLLLVICGFGLRNALLARYPRLAANEARELVGSVLSLSLISIAIVLAAFAALIWLAGARIFPELTREHYLLIASISATETVWLLVTTVYRAEGSAWRYVTVQLVQVLVALGLTVVLISEHGLREEGLLYGRLGADLVVLVLVLPVLVRCRPRALASAWGLVRVGGPLVVAAFSAMFVAMAPRLFLERIGDVGIVGSFTVDARLAGIVMIGFVQPFGLVYVAMIARIAQRPDARPLFARIITYYVALGGIAIAVVGLAAPWIARTLGKHDFPISPRAIVLLAISNVAAGLSYPLTIGPYVLERTRDVIPVYAGALVLIIVLGWPATGAGGIMGAAVALTAVYVIQGVALAWVSQRMYALPIEWRRLAVVVAGVAAVLVVVSQVAR
jgi:O-antigen/teichoic acid export membrane protein